jgi:hypothetical protein
VTVSKTQRISAKESVETKPELRYKKNSYICNLNRLTSIDIQSVTATKTTFQSRSQSNEIVMKPCHFLAFYWHLMAQQHLGKHC